MPHPNLAFIDRDKSYWHSLSASPPAPRERLRMQYSRLGSPPLLLCALLVGNRHRCRKSPSQHSPKLPSPIPIALCPRVSSWIVLPERSGPPFPLCPLVWTVFGYSLPLPAPTYPGRWGHYILSFCIFWFCASPALFSASGWYLQIVFPSACWKSS